MNNAPRRDRRGRGGPAVASPQTSATSSASSYDARFLVDLQTTMRDLQDVVQELALTVRTVQAQMPTQESIRSEIEKRLDRDTYIVAHNAMQDEMRERAKSLASEIHSVEADLGKEISDMKADHRAFEERMLGTWQRAAPWVAIGVSVIISLLPHMHLN
ncbi:MAG TPA: hypothetical protein VFN11_20755 [Ktedonobacterales bacterium]|nr:hypothetical protein [Ktedonobacterales bacterium]